MEKEVIESNYLEVPNSPPQVASEKRNAKRLFGPSALRKVKMEMTPPMVNTMSN